MELLEQWLYPMDRPPPQKRTQPMKLLALGLSRSGTDSLRQALEMLGIENVYHGFDIIASRPSTYGVWAQLGRKKWRKAGATGIPSTVTRQDFDAIIGHCTAVTDMPCASFAMEMIDAYPEALVILNTRDVDAWHKSIVSTLGVLWAKFENRVLPYFNAHLYWRKATVDDLFNAYFYGSIVQNGKMKYREHSALVRGKVPPERLLEWQIQDGWGPLCRFLDVPVPEQDFPNGNQPKEMMDRVTGMLAEDINQAWRNFYVFCTLLFIGACLLWSRTMAWV